MKPGQAESIAKVLKIIEAGGTFPGTLAEKAKAARLKDRVKFGVVTDTKVVIVEVLWTTIKQSSEAALSAYITKVVENARTN